MIKIINKKKQEDLFYESRKADKAVRYMQLLCTTEWLHSCQGTGAEYGNRSVRNRTSWF